MKAAGVLMGTCEEGGDACTRVWREMVRAWRHEWRREVRVRMYGGGRCVHACMRECMEVAAGAHIHTYIHTYIHALHMEVAAGAREETGGCTYACRHVGM